MHVLPCIHTHTYVRVHIFAHLPAHNEGRWKGGVGLGGIVLLVVEEEHALANAKETGRKAVQTGGPLRHLTSHKIFALFKIFALLYKLESGCYDVVATTK